jgi:hypothetical protein
MNDLCRELNFSPKLYPKIDLSKYDTEGYNWATFHKTPKPHELNNDYLFEFLYCNYEITCDWIEFFYTPPNSDGIIHCDNTNFTQYTKIYFQYGAEGSTLRWWESKKISKVSTTVQNNYVYIDDNESQIKRSTDYSSHDVDILVSDEKDATMIHEKDLRLPHLVNIGKLHSPHNPTNEKRFALTLAICDKNGERLLWDDAVNRLSDSIL